MFAIIFKQLFLKLNTNLGSVKKEEEREREEVERLKKKERKVGKENHLTLILTSASSSSSSSLYQKNNQIMHENTHKLNSYTFSQNQTHPQEDSNVGYLLL